MVDGVAGDGSGSDQWRDVDGAPDPARLLDFLDAVAAEPAVADAKRRSVELLAVRPGDRVLDAGCGTGADAAALARVWAAAVVGVDASRSALELARERTAVPVVQADVARLPFPAACFAGARSDRAVHHLTRPDVAVAELARVTRPGGRVVISEVTFSGRGGQGGPGGRPRDLLPFLPLLLARAGLADVDAASARCTIEPGPRVRSMLPAARAGPLTLTFVHVWGTVG